MHRKMKKIDDSNLYDIDEIVICFENCEEFKVSAQSIVDIYYDGISIHETRNIQHYYAKRGRIVIDKSAIVDMVGNMFETYDDNSQPLKERVIECPDIVCVNVYFKDGENMLIYHEYNPVMSIYDIEMEYTNCPSIKLDNLGNLTILLGELSHTNRRIDNDFENLIDGFEYLNVKHDNKPLYVKIHNIEACIPYKEMEMKLTIISKDKAMKNKQFNLVFRGIDDVTQMLYEMPTKTNLYMTTMLTGEKYCRFDYVMSFYYEDAFLSCLYSN